MFSAGVVWLIVFGGFVAVALGIYAAVRLNHGEDRQHLDTSPSAVHPNATRAGANDGKGGHAW